MLLDKNTLIFEEFIKDYKTKLTGSFIAKRKKLNQKTVSNILKKLEKDNILKSTKQGRNKLYFLNLENTEIIKKFITSVESQRTIIFYNKNPIIKEIINKIYNHIEGIIIIFGSYANNSQKTDSDLDVLIIGKTKDNEIEKIADTYNIEINLKIYPKLNKKDHLIKEVIKNHIIIKGTEEFINNIIKLENEED